MGLRINTNIASMEARRNLSAASVRREASFRRMASGQRIATAADDAAGLGMSETLRAQIRSWGAAVANIRDGLSLVGVLDGSLNEVSSLLLRMREILVTAENGTWSAADLGSMDLEFQELKAELDRIATTTEFNGMPLLAGTLSGIRIVSEPMALIETPINFADVSLATLGLTSMAVGAPLPVDKLSVMDAAIAWVSDERAEAGVDRGRLDSALVTAQRSYEEHSRAESRIRDLDFAAETAELARSGILQESASSILAQANVQPAVALLLLFKRD